MPRQDDPGWRKFNDTCNDIDRHNESVMRSRRQEYVDSIVDLNDYMRPRILADMDGSVYRPYDSATDTYRRNYDKIDWSK